MNFKYCLTILGLIFYSCSLFADETDSLFKVGNAAYARGDFEKAYNVYDGLVREGVKDASLFYNFANTCIQVNEPARAIAFYEKAIKLNPKDKEARHNLREVNKVLGVRSKTEWLENIYFLRKTKITGLLGLLFVWLGIVIIYRPLIKEKEPRKKKWLIAGLTSWALAIFLFVLTFDSWDKSRPDHFGIVVINDVVAKETPAKSGLEIFELKPGIKVRVIENEAEWSKIKADNGRKGWIPTSVLVMI